MPVIPIALRGLRGGLLSHSAHTSETAPITGKRGLFSRLQLIVGQPMEAAEVTPEVLLDRVQALRGEWK